MAESEQISMLKPIDDNQTKTIKIEQFEKETIEEGGINPHPPSGGLGLLYQIDDVPPWYMCILLGLQHYLTAFGSNLMAPLLMASSAFCMKGDTLGISELIETSFFVSGICTLIQTIFGIRLPIMQGSSFSFITPAITLFSMAPWQCPYTDPSYNGTVPVAGSEEHREIWKSRLREFQGCLMVASLVQIFIGFSGLMEVFLRFVGPLTIMPTITLIGLSLFEVAYLNASGQWYIALTVVVLIALFSQYLKDVEVPCLSYKRKQGLIKVSLPIFKMFPVLLSIFIAWILCYILTVTDVFSKTEGEWGYLARTDRQAGVIDASPWFYFPYPGQWGLPTVSTAGVLGLLAGIFCILIESVGDYYACARLTGVPPPPVHSINRAIGLEGVTCLLAGAWGSSSGSTSFSENIGAIGITKVGSRRVVQVGAIVMIVLSCFGKMGALFVTIPQPVVGGVYLSLFGMVAAVGISNLRYVSLDSSRNLFIIGSSLLMGLAIPFWIQRNPGVINTGSQILDQIASVLLGTNMFIGGFLGIFLDNTLPGTDEERGLTHWRYQADTSSPMTETKSVYNLPSIVQHFLDKRPCLKYVPFCPAYNSYITKTLSKVCSCRCCCQEQDRQHVQQNRTSDEFLNKRKYNSAASDTKAI